jgi:hypothetical protein
MELFYRHYRLIVLQPVDQEEVVVLQIVDRSAQSWTPIAFGLSEDIDDEYRRAFDYGLQIVDDACATRLATQ